MASLVGRLSPQQIVAVLTERLRRVTGDPRAVRSMHAVTVRRQLIGLQSADVVGGITIQSAAQDVGSASIVYNAIHEGLLVGVRRVGRLYVIPHEVWAAFLSRRQMPPDGYIPLARLKGPLGIRSDKLSEWARAGLVPTATRCNPFGTGHANTRWGTWWISEKAAAELVRDRRAGRPMPWHVKADPHNLKTTWRLWRQRQHPSSCEDCRTIWGEAGAPSTFEEYRQRYVPLAHGAKRHLTRPWSPGLTLQQVAEHCSCDVSRVRAAINCGALRARRNGRLLYVTKSDATRWKTRKCPSGASDRSWVSLQSASQLYGFSITDLEAAITAGTLRSKTGTGGAARGVVYVPRQQCREFRDSHGFSETEAARRVGVSPARVRLLLKDLDWRDSDRITLDVVQSMIKRVQSRQGATIEEAARRLDCQPEWVRARVRDGTVRLSRAPWDRRRTYLTEPMLNRLRRAQQEGAPARRAHMDEKWISVGRAAVVAGVSTTTILRWHQAGLIHARVVSRWLRVHEESVRAQARRYWAQCRFKRAPRPTWLAGGQRAAP